mgnify:CR=1 FL=1
MLKNLLALLIGVILLTLGLMFSVVILAVGAILGAALWIYFWWRTRALRRAMAAARANGGMDGDGAVIEGEAVRVNDDPARTGEGRLPGADGQG